MTKQKPQNILVAVLCVVLMGTMVMSGCAEAEAEPLPEPVVIVAPKVVAEPEPEPEPEPPPITLPLSGIEVTDENDPLLHTRPLSVKIENTPESRPALGITRADVVYETLTEGGITRFNALFHSDIPEEIGSVRSARNSDITIVPEYDAIFVFSGTNSLVWADLGNTWINYMEEGTSGRALYRIGHKAAPHNLYLKTELAFERAEERGYQLYTPWPKGLMYGENDVSKLGDENDAIEIFVPFSGSLFDVTWTYDPEAGNYLRFIRGQAQCDEADSSLQIAAENVILLSVPYRNAPDVPGKGQTYNLDMTGSGDAIVFRDGVRIDCTWQTDGTHPPLFTDKDGNPVLVKPGKTWFQVPRDIYSVVVTTGHLELDDPGAVEAVSEETDEEAMQAAIDADVDESNE